MQGPVEDMVSSYQKRSLFKIFTKLGASCISSFMLIKHTLGFSIKTLLFISVLKYKPKTQGFM